MECDACGHENRDEAKFCSNCGDALHKSCSQCNQPLPYGAQFCDNCGTKVTVADNTQSKSVAIPEIPDLVQPDSAQKVEKFNLTNAAERRQLTVMFCDLVGSTTISEQLDPEDMSLLLEEYRNRCKVVIDNHEGYIARYIGDGLLVYFGYPISHEDSAHQAVRAGLEIIESIKLINAESIYPAINMAVRIGINTGNVVVGDIGSEGSREHMAVVGDVPNIASRLQSIADPDAVLIGHPTFRLVKGMFEFENLGLQRLKGISERLNAYRVRKEYLDTNRFEVHAKHGLSPVAGREAEISLLIERWQRAKDGDGQVLLLNGGAGIGKSRILKIFCDQIKSEQHRKITYISSSHHRSSAFYPVISQINKAMGFEQSDTNKLKLSKLHTGLGMEGLDIDKLTIWYAFLLGLSSQNDDIYSSLSPQQCKQRVFSAVIDHFKSITTHEPLLMIVEDLHWIDPSTLELFTLWADQLQNSRCLLILTFRPSFEQRWSHYSHFTSLELSRLSRRESAKIVSAICGRKQLPTEVFDQIIAKTDGIPLFVEELTKMVLESDLLEEQENSYILKGPLPALAIPESLQDSLTARLDRLGQVKEIAQLAATIGRRFSYQLLLTASGQDPENLDSAITQLLDAELIYKRGVSPDVVYEFKHALVQETAYQTLLKSTRQQYHHRIAQVLENDFPDTIEQHPELLAHHYTEARINDKAVEIWYQAGQKAITHSANLEAIDHLKKALNCLMFLPDSSDRVEMELKLQITLAVPLTAAKGYAAPEVEKTYLRAYKLCQEIDDLSQLFQTLYGMWRFYLLRAEYKKAYEISENMINIVEKETNPVFQAAALRSMGSTQFYTGKLTESYDHLGRVIGMAPPSAEQHRQASLLDVVDVVVVSHAYNGWSLWLKGYPDQALKESERAIALAKSSGHPFSIALASSFACWTFQFCGNKERSCEIAKSALDISTEYRFNFWMGWAKVLLGWSMNDTDQSRQALMEQGLNEWMETGSRLGQTYFMILLAEIAAQSGQFNKSVEIIDKAQLIADQTGEKFWQPEILRLRGELIIKTNSDSIESAESSFQDALMIAGEQQSRSLQLRAAMSLYKLIQYDPEKSQKAVQAINKIYNGFKEGFDTVDLIAAKEVLDKHK